MKEEGTKEGRKERKRMHTKEMPRKFTRSDVQGRHHGRQGINSRRLGIEEKYAFMADYIYQYALHSTCEADEARSGSEGLRELMGGAVLLGKCKMEPFCKLM